MSPDDQNDKSQDPPIEEQKPTEQSPSISADEIKALQESKAASDAELASLKSQLEELQKNDKSSLLKEVQDKATALETALAEAQGRITEYDSRMSTTESKFKISKVVSKLREEAIAAGVKDVETFQKVVGDQIKEIKINDAFDVDVESVKNIISRAKEKQPYFFHGKTPNIDDINKQKAKVTAYEDEIAQCKTQKEFDAVRKKYNRL